MPKRGKENVGKQGINPAEEQEKRYSRWDILERTPTNIPEPSKLPSSLRVSEVLGTAFNSTGRSTDRQKRQRAWRK